MQENSSGQLALIRAMREIGREMGNPPARKSLKLPRSRPVSRRFFNRDPREVAGELLGKVLVRREGQQLLSGRIVELEVYLGQDDPAAHAFAGSTERNRVLFGPPGHAYVYFIYGNHYCLNVSCMPEGQAGSILIRALEPLTGLDAMLRERGLLAGATKATMPSRKIQRLLTSGPGRLAEAMGITRTRDNGKDLTTDASDLWIADDGFRPKKLDVTPRIGISKATEMPLRYLIADNGFVSRQPRMQ
jgi:DNA-3-methyladenine glycosylase